MYLHVGEISVTVISQSQKREETEPWENEIVIQVLFLLPMS